MYFWLKKGYQKEINIAIGSQPMTCVFIGIAPYKRALDQ
jgi:hypothetical protein